MAEDGRRKGLQWSYALNNARSIRVGFQNGKGGEAHIGWTARTRKINLVLSLGSEAFRRYLNQIQKSQGVHGRPSLGVRKSRSRGFETQTSGHS